MTRAIAKRSSAGAALDPVEDRRRPGPISLPPSAATDRDDGLVDAIRRFCADHDAASLSVVFSIAIDDDLGARLLALPQVVSVIFAAEPAGLSIADPGRVGWLRVDGRVDRFPRIVGATLLMIGNAEAFGYELARRSLIHGGARIAFDSPVGFTTPRSLKLVLISTMRRGIGRRLQSRLGRPADWRRPVALVEAIHKRSMRHALKALSDPPCRSQPAVPGRIVFVTGSLGPGGAERQLVNTLTGLSAAGRQDLHLLADQLSPPPFDFYLPKLTDVGVAITELGLTRDRGDLDLAWIRHVTKGMDPAFETELIRLMILFDRLRPAVVHAWQDGPCAKAGLAAALLGIERIVLSWRSLAPAETDLYRPHYAPVFKELAKRYNVVMVNNSEAGARSYARWLRLDPKRIGVIRNGIDGAALQRPAEPDLAAYRREIGLPTDAPVVGTIFRFGPEKRPLLWLEVAARIAECRPDVHFLMIGAGVLLDQARARIDRLGLQGRVHLPGRSTAPALALAAMDVFLLTSVLEGLPNVVIEAGALGTPVVSTDVGGVREALDHGRTGFALATDRPAALADKVLDVLADDLWRAAVRAHAPAWVRARFHTGRMIEETLEAFGIARETLAGAAAD